jgi:hypothetical protein
MGMPEMYRIRREKFRQCRKEEELKDNFYRDEKKEHEAA